MAALDRIRSLLAYIYDAAVAQDVVARLAARYPVSESGETGFASAARMPS